MDTTVWIRGIRVQVEPRMSVLKQPAELAEIGVGFCGEHRLVVHHVATNHLR